jgi:phosphinothricin acetyltransferase
MHIHEEAQVRLATAGDAEDVLKIYAPIVRETFISFEVEAPSRAEMERRITATLKRLPWLVAESRGAIAGYAYASQHRERAAYQWSVDVSAYTAAESRRRGLARRLYVALLGMLADLGYYSAFAGIALPNEASEAFHEALGFKPIGVYRKVGYKLGAWRDVGWWARPLREYAPDPAAPRGMAEYAQTEECQRRLRGE